MSRYIDADHLRRWILARWEEIDPYTDTPLRADEILAQIDRELSIDIDRPQGKWITVRQCSHGKIGRCSRCGKKYRVLCKWNFCPVCGADMRKGADNDR